MNDEITMVPINKIRILNPRYRDLKKFELIVQSIRNVGLKKPIQVSLRSAEEAEGQGYDLVCGQGRIEAFKALGFLEIPAIVVEISKEERLLRSLVENMARRHAPPADLLNEIERLKAQGDSNASIGKKLDITDEKVAGLLALKKAGEGRLLTATLQGKIPITIAMEIAKSKGVDEQRQLLQAYEQGQLSCVAVRTIKRLMDRRQLFGKQSHSLNEQSRKSKTSSAGLISAYQKQSQKQKLLIKKARICDQKLLFLVAGFSKLLGDENFVNLLRAEALFTMPKFLSTKISNARKEAA